MMTIANIDRYDMLNNPGDNKAAVTIWFTGCSCNCSGCHNLLLQDKNHGQKYDVRTVLFTVCDALDRSNLDTVVLLGGEPMEQDDTDILYLINKLHGYSNKIWLYTGMEFEDIPDIYKDHLYTIKCGMYNENLKQDGFPSSLNQRVFRKIDGAWQQINLMEE